MKNGETSRGELCTTTLKCAYNLVSIHPLKEAAACKIIVDYDDLAFELLCESKLHKLRKKNDCQTLFFCSHYARDIVWLWINWLKQFSRYVDGLS